MIDQNIPDGHHVSRVCSKTRLTEDGSRPLPAAFKIRKIDEYLSVDWLEFLDSSGRPSQIKAVREMCEQRQLRLKASAKFAVLNVGITKEWVKNGNTGNRKLFFVHQPKNQEDSHSGIFNTNHSDNDLLIATLISESVIEMHPCVA